MPTQQRRSVTSLLPTLPPTVASLSKLASLLAPKSLSVLGVVIVVVDSRLAFYKKSLANFLELHSRFGRDRDNVSNQAREK